MRLVVDACVLRSAGTTEESCSASCRHTLQSVVRARHRVHYDSLLKQEWNDHASNFARKWRVQMQQRGLLVFIDPLKPDPGLAEAVTRQLSSVRDQNAALKDIHLVILALRAGKAILSREATARKLYLKVGEAERRLRKLLWVDPTQQTGAALAWLRSEAEPLNEWRLAGGEAAS